jgi:hypothetical protein
MLALLAVTSACSSKKAAPTAPQVADVPLTSDVLVGYMKERFPAQVAEGTLILDFGSEGVNDDVIEELGLIGVTTRAQLAAIVPADFDQKGWGAIKGSPAPTSNIAGLMRDLMIIHDAKLYVEKAWRNGWVASGPEDFPAPVAYGVDLSILENGGVYNMEGRDDEGGYDEDEGYDPCAGDPCGD